MNLLDTNKILALYEKYKVEIVELKLYLSDVLDNYYEDKFLPQLSDIEAELTYMFIRELRPDNIVEFSPCYGYSSMWILSALKKNDKGKLYSYDIVDYSTKYIPDSLKDRWQFTQGDVKKTIETFPTEIDYLFIDSDHSAEFAKWYIDTVLPSISSGTYISVHDIIKRRSNGNLALGEAIEIIKWLENADIQYYTAGLKENVADLNTIDNDSRRLIDVYKKDNNLNINTLNVKKIEEVYNIKYQNKRNSMIFFRR